MAARKEVQSFNDFIQAERKKKKNEQLANDILGKNRRSSAPGSMNISADRPRRNLAHPASNAGIAKTAARNASVPFRDSRSKIAARNSTATSRPTPAVSGRGGRNNRLYGALLSNPTSNNQVNVTDRRGQANGGLTIKGLGQQLYTVVAQNFAPETTAADIDKAAETPELVSCRIVSAEPTVIAEMTFDDKEAAEHVIAKWNGQSADGRVLYVYMKGGHSSGTPRVRPPPARPAQGRNNGFEGDIDDMDIYGNGYGRDGNRDRNRDRYDQDRIRRAQPSIESGHYGFPEGPSNDSMGRSNWDRHGRNDGGLVSDRMLPPANSENRRFSARK